MVLPNKAYLRLFAWLPKEEIQTLNDLLKQDSQANPL